MRSRIIVTLALALLAVPFTSGLPLPFEKSGLPFTAAWEMEPVDLDDIDSIIGFALSAAGEPRIAYNEFSAGTKLKVAERTLAGWETTTISTQGLHPDIAVGPDGLSHVVYVVPLAVPEYNIVYASQSGDGSWSYTTLASGRYSDPHVAVDANGRVHITYYKFSSPQEMRYVRLENGSRLNETVPGYITYEMTLGPDGEPRILYNVAGSNRLYISTRSTNGSWSVDFVNEVGFMPSIAIAQNGTPHITYTNDNRQVKYAVKTGATWTVTTLDSNSQNDEPSVALNEHDVPSVVWATERVTGTQGMIKYATLRAGKWDITNVNNNPGYAGVGLDLAIDTIGFPHIAQVQAKYTPNVLEGYDLWYAQPVVRAAVPPGVLV